VDAHLRAALLPRLRLLLRRLLRRLEQRLRLAAVARALRVAPAREAAEDEGGGVAQLGLVAAEQPARLARARAGVRVRVRVRIRARARARVRVRDRVRVGVS